MKIFFFVLIIHSYSLYANTVTFCFEDRNFPPFIFTSANNQQPKGLLLDLILLSAKDAGITVNLTSKPWLRCQKLVKQNHANALFAMIQTDERSQVFAFPKSLNSKQAYLFKGQYAIFVQKNGPFDLDHTNNKLIMEGRLNLAVYHPLAKYGLFAPLGYVVRKILEEKRVLTSLNLTPTQALKFVANGKLDGFVIDRHIGNYLTKELRLTDKLIPTKDHLLETHWHVAFNKAFYQKHQKQIDNFWNAFDNHRNHLINKLSLE